MSLSRCYTGDPGNLTQVPHPNWAVPRKVLQASPILAHGPAPQHPTTPPRAPRTETGQGSRPFSTSQHPSCPPPSPSHPTHPCSCSTAWQVSFFSLPSRARLWTLICAIGAARTSHGAILRPRLLFTGVLLVRLDQPVAGSSRRHLLLQQLLAVTQPAPTLPSHASPPSRLAATDSRANIPLSSAAAAAGRSPAVPRTRAALLAMWDSRLPGHRRGN